MPSPAPNELSDLVRRAQAGCNESAQILYDKWQKPLLYVIRQKLDGRLRRIFDSDDFVQGAMAEFFARASADGDFDTPQGFLSYVTAIAENKIRDASRKYLQSQRSNFSKDVPLEHADAAQQKAAAAEGESRAEAIARLRLEIARLPLVDRTIMDLLLGGLKPAAIARRLETEVDFVYGRIETAKRKVKIDSLMTLGVNMTKACPPNRSIPL